MSGVHGGEVRAFRIVVEQWRQNGEDLPGSVAFTTREGEPYVIYQESDEAAPGEVESATRILVALCARAFEATDGGVDRATLIVLSEGRDEHPDATRWRIPWEAARAYREDELATTAFMDRVNETKQTWDADEIELDL